MHIKEDCWASLGSRLQVDAASASYRCKDPMNCPHLSNPFEAVRTAFFILFLHEFFPYQVDIAATMLEMSTGRRDMYIGNFKNAYWPMYTKPGSLEEALANRYLQGRNEFCQFDRSFLDSVMRMQPPGYWDFFLWTSSSFWQGRRNLMNQIFRCTDQVAREAPIEQILDILGLDVDLKRNRVPIYLHHPRSGKRRIFARDETVTVRVV